MALIEHKRLIAKDSKVGWIAYDTNFVDPLDDCITIYRKAAGSCFTDDGYTTFNLDCFVPDWREDGTVRFANVMAARCMVRMKDCKHHTAVS